MPWFSRPIDQFMVDASLWAQNMTPVWIAMGIAVALAAVLAVVSRRNQRIRARVPQYRRRGQDALARRTDSDRDTRR